MCLCRFGPELLVARPPLFPALAHLPAREMDVAGNRGRVANVGVFFGGAWLVFIIGIPYPTLFLIFVFFFAVLSALAPPFVLAVCGGKAFMYAYSLREKTRAARRLEDDVPPEVKQRRLEVWDGMSLLLSATAVLLYQQFLFVRMYETNEHLFGRTVLFSGGLLDGTRIMNHRNPS